MGNCTGTNRMEDVSDEKSLKKLVIKTSTWNRDSHGLFDYESNNVVKKNIKTSNNCMLIREGNDVQIAPENATLRSENARPIMNVISRDGEFTLTQSRPAEQDDLSFDEENEEDFLQSLQQDSNCKLWLVIRYLNQGNSRGYKIMGGETIKLGRVKFIIKEVRCRANEPDNYQNTDDSGLEGDALRFESPRVGNTSGNYNSETHHEIKFKQGVETEEGLKTRGEDEDKQVCRICFCEMTEDQNPLISPCKCAGSMKFIHLHCLKTWLTRKENKRESETTITYCWRAFECELCKSELSYTVTHNG